MIRRSRLFGDKTRITFILPATAAANPDARTSVVGSFNGWQPGRHELQRRRNGTSSVSVTLPPGEHHFRYLATGGRWSDDPDVDLGPHGGVLRV